jgi:hypothetical protein
MLSMLVYLHLRSLKKVCFCNYTKKEKNQYILNYETIAPGMFNQIDELSVPGAGLRHLEFQSEVPSMFQGFFSGDGGQSHMQVPLIPPSLNSAQSFVRTYGSEPEM